MYGRSEGFVALWVQAFFIVFVLVPIGLVIQYVQNSRREARVEAFKSGEFDLVVLREGDQETADRVVDAVRAGCTLRLVQTFHGFGKPRELFRVECVDDRLAKGLPVPRFLERNESETKSFLSDQTEEQYVVVYAIFTGSDSIQKTQSWLESHGFESNIPLERGYWDPDSTEVVAPKREFPVGSSTIDIAAYFRSGHFWNPRFNRWDGTRVKALHDLGDRSFVKSHSAYVQSLREVGE